MAADGIRPEAAPSDQPRRRDEAVCGGPLVDGTAVKVWNEWLEERDRAPGELLTEWVKQKALQGIEVARDYAQAAGIALPPGQDEGVNHARGDFCAGPKHAFNNLFKEADQGGARMHPPGGGYGVPQTRPTAAAREAHFESLLKQLFQLHDLNGNGSIEEDELIKINEKISMLHYGKDTDKQAIREKYSTMFREKFDAQGQPVGYDTFRRHTLQMMQGIDSSRTAQEMMLEQFIVEAESGRAAFHIKSFASFSDGDYMAHLQGDRPTEILSSASSNSTVPPTAGRELESSQPPKGPTVSKQAILPTLQEGKITGYDRPESRLTGLGSRDTSLAHSTATFEPSPAQRPSQSSLGELGGGKDSSPENERQMCEGFATGDKIQVWSNSKHEWLDGRVLEAFPTHCRSPEGYSVPPGTIKVSSSAGVKWIRPGQANASVRPRP